MNTELLTTLTASMEAKLGNLSGQVVSLAGIVEKSSLHTASEIDKLWKHVDARDERLTNAITTIAEKQANFGKPNIQAIVSVCALVGSIAFAFMAPMKADIDRESDGRKELALAVVVKEEKIQGLTSALVEMKALAMSNKDKIMEISEYGSRITRDRLTVLEEDAKWQRGEKRLSMQQPPTP